jgi:hypothetical protein
MEGQNWGGHAPCVAAGKTGKPRLVIDRKQIFLFRSKRNIRQENAAKYSADNEHSAQGSKHCKKSDL